MLFIQHQLMGKIFSHALIFNINNFSFQSQSSNNLTALNNLAWQTPQTNGNQQGRYLHVQLKQNSTNQLVDIVSVHLKWSSQPNDINQALSQLFGAYNNLAIMGDFNSDLSKVTVPGVSILASINGSQSSMNRAARLNTIDAIVYNFKTVLSASQLAQPSTSQNTHGNQLQYTQSAINDMFANNNDINSIIRDHISGCLQANVRFLVDNEFFGITSAKEIAALTPNRTHNEFQNQIKTWQGQLQSMVFNFQNANQNVYSQMQHQSVPSMNFYYQPPTLYLYAYQQYSTYLQQPQLDTEPVIQLHISGILQQKVREHLLNGKLDHTTLMRIASMTPTRQSHEFEAQKATWSAYLSNL